MLALNTVLPVLVSGAVSAVGSLSLTTDQGLTVAPDAGSITRDRRAGQRDAAGRRGDRLCRRARPTGAASLTAGGALSFTGTATTGGAITFGAGAGLTLAGTIAAAAPSPAPRRAPSAPPRRSRAAGDVTLTAGGGLTAGGRDREHRAGAHR